MYKTRFFEQLLVCPCCLLLCCWCDKFHLFYSSDGFCRNGFLSHAKPFSFLIRTLGLETVEWFCLDIGLKALPKRPTVATRWWQGLNPWASKQASNAWPTASPWHAVHPINCLSVGTRGTSTVFAVWKENTKNKKLKHLTFCKPAYTRVSQKSFMWKQTWIWALPPNENKLINNLISEDVPFCSPNATAVIRLIKTNYLPRAGVLEG